MAAALLSAGLLLGACSESRESRPMDPPAEPPTSLGASTTAVSAPGATTVVTTGTSGGTETSGTDTAVTTTPQESTSSSEPTATTPTATTERPKPTTTTKPPKSTTTTTTTAPPLDVENPPCVRAIQRGDSLSALADRLRRDTVTVKSLQRENGITNPDSIAAGDYLDICVKNKINDITGEKRKPPPPPTTTTTTAPPTTVPGGGTNFGSGVVAQQQKLNELFAGKGIAELATDGDSGSYTQQQLCAARVALGMPVNRNDMAPGGREEQALMAAGNLPIPEGAPTSASRWALIDLTCQVMFVGEGSNGVTFVFGTSTGEAGHETRLQDESQVFRYDPARKNGGWHDSTSFPVAADNPLNGNMYKPLYFDNGQAIHGAGNVPTSPQSKGCVRLRVEHQDVLVGWLGLSDAPSPVWSTGDINLAVSVAGAY